MAAQHHPASGSFQAASHSFEKFGPATAHQTIVADDLASPHRQRQVIDRQTSRTRHGEVFNAERHLAQDVAGGRRAQIKTLTHHVAHDPVEVDLATRRICGQRAVAQNHRVVGDLERLFQMVGDIDNRHPASGQVAEHLEQHADLGGR